MPTSAHVHKTVPMYSPERNDETIPSGASLPEMYPIAYMCYMNSQRCSHCGTQHSWTETFIRMAPISRRSTLREYKAISEAQYNIEVMAIPTPRRVVPFCHECVGTTELNTAMSKLPSLAETDEWRATVERKRLQLANESNVQAMTPRKPKAPPPSLADIFKTLGV
jgi:hypothetical protein